MPNPKLDIRETVARFPEQVESRPGRPAFNLFSPQEVALRENQLRLVQAELDLGPRIPAHYLLYGSGAPETREQSRIGGLPYRPRDLEWPKDSDGRPKEFVCQIDFSDSRFLLPELPGQIMLLFVAEEGIGGTPFTLEWYPHGLRDLVNSRELPQSNFTYPIVRGTPVFCCLYETYDFPEASSRIRGTRFEKWNSFGTPCAGKIGGFNNSIPPGNQHILTLESIRFLVAEPYPFVRRRGWNPSSVLDRLFWRLAGTVCRATGVRNRCYDILMIGDLGRIHVFEDASGQFQVTDESY
ncbi:MAG: DUF1963 domain-containing protein [Proteobacteria bacterium]|nr:DUF1963 domain-containing protein [Pseudomonadota bacterium]